MKKSLNIFLLIILPNFLFAQISIHKELTLDDGLVQNQVTAMIQDSKGYIWFATYDGVSKWDGKNFENIQTHNGMLSPIVLDIEEGLDGKIYMACYQGGVLVYEDGVLDTLDESDGLLNNDVFAIAILSNGDILFGVNGGNISKLTNGKFSDWGKKTNYPSDVLYTVRDFYQENDSTLYIATQKGLLIYDNNSFEILTTKDGLNNNLLLSVAGNKQGTIYLSSYKGINKLENGIITKLTDIPGFSDAFSFGVYVSNKGIMYAVTANGLIIENDGKIQTLTENNGLAFNNCSSIMEDVNGTIYIGTFGKGVSVYNPNESIINFNKSTGLPNESIWGILKSKDGTLYLGSVEGLIIIKNNSTKILNSKLGLVDDFIRVVKESRDGRILVGTNKGFSIIDEDKIKNFKLINEFAISIVYTVAETNSGDLILGTQNGVVVIRDDKIIKEESESISNSLEERFGSKTVYSISTTKNGSIIFGTQKGLAIYNRGEYSFFNTKNGLVDDVVNATHMRADGSLFIGTYKGINILKGGKIVDTIDVSDGLSNNAIADIEEDDKGRIFVPSTGLNILTYSNDSLTINNIDKIDGLVDNDFTLESTFIDDEGNLWLGTLYGVTKYNPNLDEPITVPPHIYLTGLQLFHKDYPLKKFLKNPTFNYDENFLKFIYTGINLSAPEKIKYQYRLSGIDKYWVKTIESFSTYTNLDDGDYKFEVKAGNEWGYWSEPTSLSFTINPAWWETWWFYTLAIICIGALIAFIASYRYRQLLAVEKIRTKISSDLHDSIGSGLSEITILSELLNAQPNAKVDDLKSGLGNISVTARSLVGNMSDIVWLVNPSKDSLRDLLLRLQDSYQEVLAQANISFEIKNIEQLEKLRLPMTFRQHLFLLFKEAINNSLKYSKCSEMILDIKQSGKELYLSLSDNGIGFDLENYKEGNGLINMQERAKAIYGELEIFSDINEGTTLKFYGKI